jgi:NADH dehydrogenase FAD-containing subunit
MTVFLREARVIMDLISSPTVILGGGFVGLFTALHLGQENYPGPVLLIDPNDRFTFKPLLYELLTGELHRDQICPRYRDLLVEKRVSFLQDSVEEIDLPNRRFTLASGASHTYSHLVLALGSQPTYFNIPGTADYVLPFASAMDALTLKARLQDCLHTAVQTPDLQQRQPLLTVAIIGAGPAGVELAATLADLLPVWLDEMGGDIEEIRVVLVNRGHEILKGDINSRLRSVARQSLGDRTVAVELVLDAAVKTITSIGVEYQQQDSLHFLPAMTVVWTGGTKPHPLLQKLSIAADHRDRQGRVRVLPTLQLPEYPEVFVGGDCALVTSAPQPPTAQVAYQQGKAIAHNLKALNQRRYPLPSRVNLRGTLMKLGIGEGVANLFDRLEVKGEAGHLLRQATYLELLPKPLHNLKQTTEWFADELLQRHQTKSLHPSREGRTPLLAGITATVASLLLATPLIWRAAQPEHFQQNMTDTGLPELMNQLSDHTPPKPIF